MSLVGEATGLSDRIVCFTKTIDCDARDIELSCDWFRQILRFALLTVHVHRPFFRTREGPCFGTELLRVSLRTDKML